MSESANVFLVQFITILNSSILSTWAHFNLFSPVWNNFTSESISNYMQHSRKSTTNNIGFSNLLRCFNEEIDLSVHNKG